MSVEHALHRYVERHHGRPGCLREPHQGLAPKVWACWRLPPTSRPQLPQRATSVRLNRSMCATARRRAQLAAACARTRMQDGAVQCLATTSARDGATVVARPHADHKYELDRCVMRAARTPTVTRQSECQAASPSESSAATLPQLGPLGARAGSRALAMKTVLNSFPRDAHPRVRDACDRVAQCDREVQSRLASLCCKFVRQRARRRR